MNATNQISRDREWKHGLLLLVAGLIIFETLTGLSIYLLPFSVSNQVMVIVHTLIGLVFFIPIIWYQIRHWMVYRSTTASHFKFTGYILTLFMILLTISGLYLTFQAVFQTRISYAWDLIHIISTFGFIAFVIPHIIVIMVRDFNARKKNSMIPVLSAQKQFSLNTFFIIVILFLVIALLVYAYEPVQMNNEFPQDYSYLYGKDRPFAPSLANTNTGGAFDQKSMGQSKSCGTSGCHEQIYEEWQVSAHRYSAMDVAFQAVQKVMAEQNGAESTRYCGGCHDPISLFSGEKNIFNKNLTNLTGYQEGVSCIVCHAIKETDIKGNANYVITQPERYMFDFSEDGKAKFLNDFLIRAYPAKHIESLQHRMFKSPEFCGACHKQFIDQEVNQVGWVQLQNQYDNWRKSRWNHPGDPTKTIECRECHMRLIDSTDPASGDPLDYNRTSDDMKHRSHRFLAANQFMPKVLDLPGAEEHTVLTEKWLQGEIDIPEIADKWRKGPAVPIELLVPEKVRPGEEVKLEVHITNNKVGHDFPTGPLDIIQAWVELVVTDQDGREVFVSGSRDDRHFIQKGSFIFKAEAVDQYGNLIDRHNLWEMVGVRFRRAMFPGFSDMAEYAFPCPTSMTIGEGDIPKKEKFNFKVGNVKINELHVSAKLMYRKVDQFLLNFLLGEESGVTAPITIISEETKKIEVTDKESS
jgi:hypothetical protein